MLEEVNPPVQFATLGLFHQRAKLGAIPTDDKANRSTIPAGEVNHIEDQVHPLSRHEPGQRQDDRLLRTDAERTSQVGRILLGSLEIDRVGSEAVKWLPPVC